MLERGRRNDLRGLRRRQPRASRRQAIGDSRNLATRTNIHRGRQIGTAAPTKLRKRRTRSPGPRRLQGGWHNRVHGRASTTKSLQFPTPTRIDDVRRRQGRRFRLTHFALRNVWNRARISPARTVPRTGLPVDGNRPRIDLIDEAWSGVHRLPRALRRRIGGDHCRHVASRCHRRLVVAAGP